MSVVDEVCLEKMRVYNDLLRSVFWIVEVMGIVVLKYFFLCQKDEIGL